MNRESHQSDLGAREYLRARLQTDLTRDFGVTDSRFLSEVVNAWMNDETNSAHRFDTIKQYVPSGSQILDMASGCGTCVFYGLAHGYDIHGIDPEQWKHEFVAQKAREKRYPEAWLSHFHAGVGEALPFPADSFDCVTSYQTLEHVQDPSLVIHEMLRVTRRGGLIHIQCPDYLSLFEGHYQLPWLPLFPKTIARAYLRCLRRPVAGLAGIQYIRTCKLLRWIRAAARTSGKTVQIIDTNRAVFAEALNRRQLGGLDCLYGLFRLYQHARTMFRNELSINLIVLLQ